MNRVVALDVRRSRRLSQGMLALVDALDRRLAVVAPDLELARITSPPPLTLAAEAMLPRTVARLRPAFTHYTTPYVPVFAPRPYAVTVHDLIPVQFPQQFSRANRLYFRFALPRTLRRAALVFCSDPRTRDEIVARFALPAQRLRVIPLGYREELLGAGPLAGPRPYLLYAGNDRPHKDLQTLLRAWRALPDRLGLDLVIAGRDNTVVPERTASRELRVLGEVGEAQLWSLYAGAFAYVHPALVEGFGIPMLEALAAGTPVVASERAVPAIVRPFATLFPAADASALRNALLALWEAPEAARAQTAEGAATVRAYTWDRFAALTAQAYRDLLEAVSPE